MDEFFSLAIHVYKIDMHKRKEKKNKKKTSSKTQTEILGTAIRLQRIFIRAFTSPKALKTSRTVLMNLTVSPSNTDVNTVHRLSPTSFF